MVRALLDHIFRSEQLDEWFKKTSVKQYERELLFSSIFALMSEVVFCMSPSINRAYQDAGAQSIGVSLTSVYNKINGLETTTSSELVRYSAQESSAIIEEMGGIRDPWIHGLKAKILDGNCIESTERRLGVLRDVASAPLPGKSLVVYHPDSGVVIDVFPCEDGHAQERSLLEPVLRSVEADDLWIADRNFCVRSFLLGIIDNGGYFIIRQHQGLAWEALGPMKSKGQSETGKVFEQRISIKDDDEEPVNLRRIRVVLKEPTRDGEKEIFILTNLSQKQAQAKKVAKCYRRRWTIETAFQQLEKNIHSEINTLGYPQAALFGFCVALVAYNMMAVILAAMGVVMGNEKVDQEVSTYALAVHISSVYEGMMIAVDPEIWNQFQRCSTKQIAEFLIQLAAKVNLEAVRKYPRGPKKKAKKAARDPGKPHVATSRLLL